MTTVCVTHDQREALTMSDRVAVIHHGRVRQVDAPRTIYERPRSRFVGEFLGESAFLEVEIRNGECLFSGQPLVVTQPTPQCGPALLMLRPERLRLLKDNEPRPMNRFEGRVSNVVYQGDSVLLHIALPSGCILPVRGRPGAALPGAGDPVTVGLAPEDAFILNEDAAAA